MTSLTRRGRWILAAVAAVVVVIGVAAYLLTRGDGEPPAADAPTPGPTGSAPPDFSTLGTGSDGDLRFVAHSLQCGLENVITAETRVAAEGQFCLVDVDVTNEGAAPVEWPMECQFLGLSDGQLLSPRPQATLLDPGSQAAFDAPLEAGQTYAEVGLIFDIPAEASVGTVELHAACGSEGLVIEA